MRRGDRTGGDDADANDICGAAWHTGPGPPNTLRGQDMTVRHPALLSSNTVTKLALVFAALCVAVAATDCEAKGIKVKIPRGVGLHGKPSYGPDVLKPDQLEQCLRLERDINSGADTLDATEQALNAKTQTVDQLGKDLNRSQLNMDRTSQLAIDLHNSKVSRYNKLVREYRYEEKDFNERVRIHNANIDQFNTGCANKKYYEIDMKAAREKVGS